MFKFLRPFLFLCIVIAILLITRFISILSFSDPELYFLEKERVFLAEDSILQQRFIATQNNLAAIGLIIDKSSLIPPPGSLIVSLKDEECRNILAQKEINLLHIFYSRIPKMTFPTITDSSKKTFCFEITYELDETEARAGEFINVWKSRSPQFSKTTYSDNGEVSQGYSLIFRPYYKEQTISGSLAKLIERISQYKSDFFKGKMLISLLVASFIFSYGVAAILLSKNHDRN